MRKVAGAFSPVVAVDRSDVRPLHKQIYDAYRTAILKGNLGPGDRIPSSRELALELGVSRLPVLNAYAQLLAEDVLESRRGAGTFVSKALFARDPRHASRKTEQGRATPGSRTISRRAAAQPALARRPWSYGQGAFAVGQVALEAFPFHLWSRLVLRHSREAQPKSLHFSDPMGSLDFRKSLAAYLRTVRAVNCEPEQLMIVSGSQQALEVTVRVLFDPGSRIWIEEPSYWLARRVLLGAGCRIVPVPVDQEGLSVSAGIKAFRRARGAIVSPSHQFPLGAIMTVARRRQLLEWAERVGSWIIEDDYDSEYRYRAMPVPSLQGMDSHAGVIYIGTFSKTLFPALRVGYIVCPKDLIDHFAAVRHAMDLFPPQLYQDVLTEFIEAGHYARHVRRTKLLYQERRDALVESINREFDGSAEVMGTEAGLHLTLKAPLEVSDQEIALRAARHRLWLYPLSACYHGSPQTQGFILGFGNAPKKDIPGAVQTLKRLLPPFKH